MWNGKQKAALAALLAFVTTLLSQIISGDPIDVSDEIRSLAELAAALAFSAVSSALMWLVVYFKTNILADGTEQRFVDDEGMVMDSAGTVIDAVATRDGAPRR